RRSQYLQCKEITGENMEEIHLMGRPLRNGLRSFWRVEALKKESGDTPPSFVPLQDPQFLENVLFSEE
ncbi:hypothetical protein L9F63_024472, partial [Diploptera punctata]